MTIKILTQALVTERTRNPNILHGLAKFWFEVEARKLDTLADKLFEVRHDRKISSAIARFGHAESK